MSVETPKTIDIIESTQEDLLQLKSQVEKPQNNKKNFEYLNKSKNKDYDVYRYKLYTPGIKLSKQAVIKYLEDEMCKQFWWYPEWCQFTDANWKEITKNWFENWDYVYLRIPQFRVVKKFSDKEKRNWKVCGYRLKGWEDYEELEGIYHNMSEEEYTYLLPGRNFCDKDWKPIKNPELKKWNMVYIKIPNMDVEDNVPEMTMADIDNLSENQVKDIFDSYQELSGSDAIPNKWSKYEHADKKGKYIMIKGKKLYIQYPFSKNPRLLSGQPRILVEVMEWNVGQILIWQYDWKKFHWVEYGFDSSLRKKYKYNKWEIEELGNIWFR